MSNWKKIVEDMNKPQENNNKTAEKNTNKKEEISKKEKTVEDFISSLKTDESNKEFIDQYNFLEGDIKKEAYDKLYAACETYKNNKNNLEIKGKQIIKILFGKQQRQKQRQALISKKEEICRQNGNHNMTDWKVSGSRWVKKCTICGFTKTTTIDPFKNNNGKAPRNRK